MVDTIHSRNSHIRSVRIVSELSRASAANTLLTILYYHRDGLQRILQYTSNGTCVARRQRRIRDPGGQSIAKARILIVGSTATATANPKHILTIRKTGYRLVDDQ